MQHFNAPEKGFNLIEIIAVVLGIGILAAIAAPSLVSWYERERLQAAIQAVRGAVIDARHQAIRQGKPCRLKLDGSVGAVQGFLLDLDAPVDPVTGPKEYVDPVTKKQVSCLSAGSFNVNDLSGFRVGEPIRLWAKSTPTPPQVIFTFRGNSLNDLQFLLYQNGRPSSALGVEVTAGLGLVRVCRYQDTQLPPTTLSSTNCPTIP